jgi:hypothetical protein
MLLQTAAAAALATVSRSLWYHDHAVGITADNDHAGKFTYLHFYACSSTAVLAAVVVVDALLLLLFLGVLFNRDETAHAFFTLQQQRHCVRVSCHSVYLSIYYIN